LWSLPPPFPFGFHSSPLASFPFVIPLGIP
jgi:hypothetical protein